MSVAAYPTAGSPGKSTVVYRNQNYGPEYTWWTCDNCKESSKRRNLSHSEDNETVNVVRREAKAHAAACDI
ncbi:hypothetical protein ACFYUY_01445 [Kitasatospora sp. NPDC004745]|uniref:hypothetical protein n=1 Tax=Kitasatospora sp. NPDC004745 TaxID=3364019 RepID=UPI0036972A10